MISNTGSIRRPRSNSLTAGSRRPSWKISVTPVAIEPGVVPPTSFQWAMLAVQAIRRPCANTGIATTTSFRWVTPP